MHTKQHRVEVRFTGRFETISEPEQAWSSKPRPFRGATDAMVGLSRELRNAFDQLDPEDWDGCDWRAQVSVYDGPSTCDQAHRVAFFDLLTRDDDGDFGSVTATLEREQRYLCVLGNESWFTNFGAEHAALALEDCPLAWLPTAAGDGGAAIAWLDLHTGDITVLRVELRTTVLEPETPLF